jgi:formate C-acetyltransferase
MVGITNVVNTMHGEYVTLPFISTFTEDCLGRLKEVHDGGALYNHDGPQGVGLADTADSLAALKKLVFEDREIKIDSLLEALSSNFNGHEHIQHLLLRKAPKYGNNEPYVDELARELSSFFCREVGRYRNPRGGNFVPGLYSVSANVPIGLYVGATPNGRTARSPVAEACSPVHGCDVNGPTQAALSVAHLDHVLATNGTQYNQKYHPGALEGTKGLQALVNLIRTFFAEGGYHIQFNVITAAKLRKAQKFPEKYRDLVIRVAGYSAFFVDLDETIQEDIIERTELEFH